MPNKNKLRGTAHEYRIINMAKKVGVKAVRARGSDGRSLGYSQEVDGLLEDFPFQAKKRKKLAAFLDIPEDCKTTIFATDYEDPKVLMELSFYLELLKVWSLWWALPTNRKPTNDLQSE